MNSGRITILLAVFALAAALNSCGPPAVVEIADRRALSREERQPQVDLETAERLGTDAMIRAAEDQAKPQGAPGIDYTVPEGWKELEASGMRDVDLRFGEGDAGEVSVIRAGGSLADNVNRWRKQMGREPLSEDDLAKLEMGTLFGIPAHLVTIDGDFKGFGESESKPNYRLVGIILSLPEFGRSFFVKMTGPRAVVEENEEKFHEFTASLGLKAQR